MNINRPSALRTPIQPNTATGAATMNAAKNPGPDGNDRVPGGSDLFQGGQGPGPVAGLFPGQGTALTPEAQKQLARDGRNIPLKSLENAVRLLENLADTHVLGVKLKNDDKITVKEAQESFKTLERLLNNAANDPLDGSLTEIMRKDNSWFGLGKFPDTEKGETFREHREKIRGHYNDLLAAARFVVNNKNIAGLDRDSGTISVRDVHLLKGRP